MIRRNSARFLFLALLFSIGGCAPLAKLSPERIDTATKQTIIEEIERVQASGAPLSEEPAAAYLNELEGRLKFLDPFFKGRVDDPAAFREALLDAERDRAQSQADEAERSRQARRAPGPAQIANFSEMEVRKSLDLLERGEFSGGYSDEDLAAYGNRPDASPELSANGSAREDFKMRLKMRLCDFYPEWGEAGRNAVIHGRLFPGMPREEVVASWGYPSTIEKLEGAGADELWSYEGFRKVYIKDNHLVRYQD